MSEHLALRSSVGSHSSALPPSYHHHRRLPPPQQQHPDPLNSVWIRRLHLLPHQPPPPRPASAPAAAAPPRRRLHRRVPHAAAAASPDGRPRIRSLPLEPAPAAWRAARRVGRRLPRPQRRRRRRRNWTTYALAVLPPTRAVAVAAGDRLRGVLAYHATFRGWQQQRQRRVPGAVVADDSRRQLISFCNGSCSCCLP
ncbi:hypothetical protein EE612_019753 [Oryza sativa]|nr:hypothetical protein EE612_019753 [Oryza sativa]